MVIIRLAQIEKGTSAPSIDVSLLIGRGSPVPVQRQSPAVSQESTHHDPARAFALDAEGTSSQIQDPPDIIHGGGGQLPGSSSISFLFLFRLRKAQGNELTKGCPEGPFMFLGIQFNSGTQFWGEYKSK